jgi:hypothetical protein
METPLSSRMRSALEKGVGDEEGVRGVHIPGKMAWGACCISDSVVLCTVGSGFPKRRKQRVTWQVRATYLARFAPFPFPLAAFFPFPITSESSSTSSVASFVDAFGFLLDLSAPDSARLRFSAAGDWR